ncbi:MAG: hypothetical protein ACI4BA_04945 [Prevotella sp.]
MMENATLYVPASVLDDYKTTMPWSSIVTILLLTEEQTPVEAVTAYGRRTDESTPVFNMRGQRVDKNARGLVIVGGKKVVR